jgi:hypothetical protein
MAALTKSEAKTSVVREWDRWAAKHVPSNQKASGNDGFAFYQYLRKEQPELLNFKTGEADRWQTVHAWLLREGKVKD